MARDIDIVLFGASGFVGRLTAAHLATHAPTGTRIALAGRSRERLAAVARDLGPAAADWPLVVADASDEASLRTLAESAHVVVSTVGPYLRHGLPLVQACARAGTHYADLTGEVLFARRSIDTAHETARASGARIVHSCGFDSVPSDLAVLLAHDWARTHDAGPLASATLEVVSARGGFSGGTVDSLRLQLDTARRDPQARRLVADPYALSPERASEPDLGRQPDAFGPHRRGADGRLGGPLRHGLLQHPGGTTQQRPARPRLRPAPALRGGHGVLRRTAALRATAVAGVCAGLTGLLAVQPLRPLLDRLLPSPGTGPSEQHPPHGPLPPAPGRAHQSGRRATVTVAAQGDPGYAATAVMLGESALALALDGDRLPARAGVLTPATGIGHPARGSSAPQGFHARRRGLTPRGVGRAHR